MLPRTLNPIAALLGVAVIMACTPDDTQRSNSAARQSVLGVPSTTSADSLVPPSWSSPGAAFLLALAGDADTAHVVAAHAAPLDAAPAATATSETGASRSVDLFSRSGAVAQASLEFLATAAPPCAAPRRALVRAAAPWTLALPSGLAVGVPLDSIERLSGRDSLALAVVATGLAVRVADDTVAALSGLPYVVRGVWQFSAGDRGEVLVAIAIRNLGLEADPRTEHLLVIADRAPGTGAWATRVGERRSGPEDTVDSDAMLAVVALASGGAPVVFLERSGAAGAQVVAYERHDTGAWVRAWASARHSCEER